MTNEKLREISGCSIILSNAKSSKNQMLKRLNEKRSNDSSLIGDSLIINVKTNPNSIADKDYKKFSVSEKIFNLIEEEINAFYDPIIDALEKKFSEY